MRPISRSEVMAELADVWEGNPRLTLYELFDVLRRAGLAPDSTNYEALSLCSYLTSLRPARVPLTPQGQATTPPWSSWEPDACGAPSTRTISFSTATAGSSSPAATAA
ncbi:hypothetical protein [Corynebacterium matruchotii]|uniref:hypothetical protein n=1 Tax=Corynebacterium matruchotii TaxID=43768 RepID=UPI001E4515D1|nr:hypothetical protein [Corynebacterium matruchotii]